MNVEGMVFSARELFTTEDRHLLPAGARVYLPPFIPVHLPAYPSPHTYISSPMPERQAQPPNLAQR
jgi:hypothetical protein